MSAAIADRFTPKGNWQNLARLALAILLVQALFWFAIKPVLIDKPETDFQTYEPYEISDAAIDRPDYSALASAKFETVEDFGAWHCCELGYRALRYHVDLETVPQKGLGLYPNNNTDNHQIFVNGSFVASEGDMTLPTIRFGALLRKIYLIPPSALKPGKNEIAYVLVRDGVPYFDYNRPIIGEYEPMMAQMSDAMFFAGPYKFMALAVIGVIALFSFFVLVRAEKKTEIFWFFMVSASWSALSLYYVWIDRPMHGAAHMSFYFCVALLLPTAWFCWADSWSAKKLVWPKRIAIASYLVIAPAMVASLYLLPSGPNFDQAGELLDYASIVLSLATITRIAWGFSRTAEDRHWEAAIMILLATLLLLNAITELTHSINMGYVSRSQPFIILAFAIAFFNRNFRLFRSTAQINTMLQGQLQERTEQLELAHTREKELVRFEAYGQERQRIMRDMHDGLGSNLMSMLMMAKRGKAEHSDYAEGLQQVIDEMRLMIDSMDSVGESLGGAFSIFRKRIIPRAKAAGFDCSWDMAQDCTLPEYGPRNVLQIFRILQEAFTNALKHSGGDRIDVAISPGTGLDTALQIVVADNGKGLAGPKGRGRGLNNMQARAESIGAKLAITDGESGTRVVLALPAPSA